MKYIHQLSGLLVVFVLVFAACEPVEYAEIGEPFSKVTAIEGSWKLTSIVQVDEDALASGGRYTELDLTDKFNFRNYMIEFQLDEDTLPSTFSVLPNGAPNFIDTLGVWTYDDNSLPTEILFVQKDSVKVSSKLRLIAPPRDKNPLRVKYQRFYKGEPIVSYKYTFEKQTQ